MNRASLDTELIEYVDIPLSLPSYRIKIPFVLENQDVHEDNCLDLKNWYWKHIKCHRTEDHSSQAKNWKEKNVWLLFSSNSIVELFPAVCEILSV